MVCVCSSVSCALLSKRTLRTKCEEHRVSVALPCFSVPANQLFVYTSLYPLAFTSSGRMHFTARDLFYCTTRSFTALRHVQLTAGRGRSSTPPVGEEGLLTARGRGRCSTPLDLTALLLPLPPPPDSQV